MNKQITAVLMTALLVIWVCVAMASESVSEPLLESFSTMTFPASNVPVHALHSCNIRFEDNTLLIESTGPDPYCHFVYGVPAGKYRMNVYFAQPADEVGKWDLFWATPKSGYCEQLRAASCELREDVLPHESASNLLPENKEKHFSPLASLSIDFQSEDEIRSFRLDPPDRTGTWKIAKIELLKRTDNPIVVVEKKSYPDKVEFVLKNESETSSVQCAVCNVQCDTKRSSEVAGSNKFTNSCGSTQLHTAQCTMHTSPIVFAPGEKKTITLPGSGKYYEQISLTIETKGGFKPYTVTASVINLDINSDGWKEIATSQGVWKFAPDEKGYIAVFIKKNETKPCTAMVSDTSFHSSQFVWRIDGAVLTLMTDSQNVPNVMLYVMGEMTNASFPGIEMLEKGEQSSSQRSVKTPKYYRVTPPTDWVTQTSMLIITDRCRASLRWFAPDRQPEFAVPDFVDGTGAGGRMGLRSVQCAVCSKQCDAKRSSKDTGNNASSRNSQLASRFSLLASNIQIVIDNSDWVSAVLDDCKAVYWNLPDVPDSPRSFKEQSEFCREAFQTKLRNENGWGHCVESHWGRAWFADLASCDWRLSEGKIDYADKEFVPGGGHITNPTIYFVTSQVQRYLDQYGGRVRAIIETAKKNPAMPYYGKYDETHWEHETLGGIANPAVVLLEYAYVTGDKEALETAETMLEKAKRFTVPRGAQTWEMPLHTPDPLAAARAIKAYVLAYELTGKQEYLEEARKWAILGIPYIYLHTVGNVEKSTMAGCLYATIGVYGATNWNEPFWIGRPVQWIGTVYAYSLLYLAPHDKTVDWSKLAHGILVSAQYQQYTDGPFKGTLPDSVYPRTEIRLQWNINPSALMYIDWKLRGINENVTAIANEKYRVASPFAMTFVQENEVKFDVPDWMIGKPFQVLVNGQIRDAVGGENLKTGE